VAYLVDTNILVRIANTLDPAYPVAIHAISELHRRGESLHITPQNLVEFRSVATRPMGQNGLGLSSAEASSKAAGFEQTFPLLEDTPAIYPAWKAIVDALGVIGKQVHDARLIACCHVHGISHLLTFDAIHFVRLATASGGLMIVVPSSI
jgi:predicted nucleic acid-binding protein